MSTVRGPATVWVVGMLAYVTAILHRTSLGVTGLAAVDRFDTTAGVLSLFVVVQLVVYAAMQIPVGVLLDRFGSRVLIAGGALLMGSGQVTLALVDTVPLALLGRVLVGAGDAMTFISVLRLVVLWFPAERVPLFMQLTGILGQLGQVLSAFPLVALLQLSGWPTTFVSLGSISVLLAGVVWLVVRDEPSGSTATVERMGLREMGSRLRTVSAHPGTRLAFWTHFLTPFPVNTFALMWGYPFLVAGQGLSPTAASGVLTLLAVSALVFGPIFAEATRRHPLRRSWLVLAIAGAATVMWTVVLAWPGPAPVPLLVLLVVVIAAGGPGSMIGFDFARTFNPRHSIGTANGVVNVGGFAASLAAIALIGVTLDLASGGGPFTLGDFRVAMATQGLVTLVGVAGVLRSRRRVRERLASEGVVVPPVRDVLARRRRARSARRASGDR